MNANNPLTQEAGRKRFRDLAVLTVLTGTGMYRTCQDALARDTAVEASEPSDTLNVMRMACFAVLLQLPEITVLPNPINQGHAGTLVVPLGEGQILKLPASARRYIGVFHRSLCAKTISRTSKE
ncbi:hypothetical protein F3K02_18270 [Hydrogenophaga sp. D2P1]|uniref:Uncharacterized protein n=1 Tax=Hydrogenophaga aromaticivorans TaxID=2610898 RepID=A0A7Y8GYF2_9BURK|nr:hypothetical protein [Hydrogenophaga aromaticivorans]NWF47181.1 hypothetical protein [Hydrogenophaga aromaticivorans]